LLIFNYFNFFYLLTYTLVNRSSLQHVPGTSFDIVYFDLLVFLIWSYRYHLRTGHLANQPMQDGQVLCRLKLLKIGLTRAFTIKVAGKSCCRELAALTMVENFLNSIYNE